MSSKKYTLPTVFQTSISDAPSITMAWGDGIGPEIMNSTLQILAAAGARLNIQEVEIGEKVYLRGIDSGMEHSAWDSLRATKVLLKAPITTPQGGGYKSLNVTIRKTLGLYANVRPCQSYHPFVKTKHPNMDVVIIRENEEDTYAGIEYRQTREVTECLKIITRPGCEKIVRYAFEYARLHNRKKVTCFIKDNIMKLTDGLFHTVFKEIAEEYPDIQHDSLIVDIGTALLADQPERFDVIVTLNLYGDIISDVAAQIAGSVALAGSANIGEHCAMFEAIHGSAPTIAGKDIANPSALIQASVMMLLHLHQPEVAEKIQNALLKTIEDGIHPADIFLEGLSKQKVGTEAFTEALISNLGQHPHTLKSVHFSSHKKSIDTSHHKKHKAPLKKELIGADIFLDWSDSNRDPNILGKQLEKLSTTKLKLSHITSRGTTVFPHGVPETSCVDHWRCRFIAKDPHQPIRHADIIEILTLIAHTGLDFIKVEHLYTFDGLPGFAG